MYCNFESCNKITIHELKTNYLIFKVLITIKYANLNRKMIILLRTINYIHS